MDSGPTAAALDPLQWVPLGNGYSRFRTTWSVLPRIAAVLVVILAWFAILFTGRYPSGLFHFVESVIRWHNRVIA